ncbi:MAG: NAD(P)-dependent glycerol-3-phosphate dehydrogenase [Gammaproteobacteria bacterium]|nr:MAG: NAD(P)-dependent glycerol-3-phosphate dehydrogenase [Gammaproteobacteria bacterium]
MSSSEFSYTVIGGGSWGCALGILLAGNGKKVALWDIDSSHMESMSTDRENKRYLPGISFPQNLHICSDIGYTIRNSEIILVVVPSEYFRNALESIAPFFDKNNICWATKGLDANSGGLLHQTAIEILPSLKKFAVISGPNFAKEVAKGLPTAVTVASNDDDFAQLVANDLHNNSFRPYISNDIIGVEAGGAVKNVLAVAAGISDGLGYGANARAGLITRGLKEISVLGKALGAKAETFSGLAGLGDLILTCTDDQSRNRRFGLSLGQGKKTNDIIQEIGQAIEGIRTSYEIEQLSKKHKVEMPICHEVFEVIHNNKKPTDAVKTLLSRPAKKEQ